jgi:putative redox protein
VVALLWDTLDRMSKPPVPASLVWEGDLRFRASSDTVSMVLDGDSTAGPSPVQTLAFSLAGCMAMDVAAIVTKGRHLMATFDVKFVGVRAEDHPRRFLKMELHFTVHGNVPAAAVERAIELSREKYCSVWQSLREDIELTTTFEVFA